MSFNFGIILLNKFLTGRAAMYIYIGTFIVVMAIILFIMRPRTTTIVQNPEEEKID